MYGDRNVHESSWTSVAVGIIYAAVVIGTLQLIIVFYPQARFETFQFLALFAAGTSYIVFSNQRYFAVDQAYGSIHRFTTILRLWITVFVVMIIANFLTKSSEDFSRVVMVVWLVVTPVMLQLASYVCHFLLFRLYSGKDYERRAIFIGMDKDAQALARSVMSEKIMGIRGVGYFDMVRHADMPEALPYLGTLDEVNAWVAKSPVDIVFIELGEANMPVISTIVEQLQDSVSSLYFVPQSDLFGVGRLQQSQVAGFPLLVAYETPFIGVARVLKRLMDIVLSSLILLMLLPVLLAIAIGVKLSSPGPVIFKQKRYGMGGMTISVWKFRSMYVHQEKAGVIEQATQDDARITPFGHFLRKTSLDELPQFFNVLQGSMSIVGPRPHAIEHNELYRKKIRGYMLRHKVKPGITGWAQVNGYRGETQSLDKMQKRLDYDLQYIRNWSLRNDMMIILRTIALVFSDRHAY